MFKVLSTPQLSAKKCKWISASRSLSKKGGRVDFWSLAREGGGNQMHLGKKNGAKGREVGRGGVGKIKIKQNFIHPCFNSKTKKYVKIRQATKEPMKKRTRSEEQPSSPSVWSPPILLTPQLSN